MFSKKILIAGTVGLVVLAAGAAAYYFFFIGASQSGSYDSSYTRVRQDETTFSYITDAEVRKTAGNQYGDVYIQLSDGEEQLVLESDAGTISSSSQDFGIEQYESVAVSPNQRFAAIQGRGFENPFVLVYQVFTESAQERVQGQFTGWTTDGRMNITQCGETEEECVERTSDNSKTPWILKEIVTEDDSILGNAALSPDVDFITNINRVGSLSTFARMIKAGGRFVSGTGPFTIFAPTNAAFSAEDQTIVNDLLKPENKSELQQFLRNHVLVPDYSVAELEENAPLTTQNDTSLTVASSTINGEVLVEIPDIVSSNGIIHIIDSVLLPTAETDSDETDPVE